MKQLTISRSSKLYRCINWLDNKTIWTVLISSNVFNNICSFVRSIFLLLFIALPLTIVFILSAINILIVRPFISLSDANATGSFILGCYVVISFLYASLLAVQYAITKYKERKAHKQSQTNYVEPSKKEPGSVSILFTTLSSKHSDFCERLSLRD